MEEVLRRIQTGILAGSREEVVAGIEQALSQGLSAEKILQEGMIAAMREVGSRFEVGEYYIPEMLLAARAMHAGVVRLESVLKKGSALTGVRVLLATVKGDVHDIGKNLVGMMLAGAGYEVIDLGTDVDPQTLAEAVRKQQPGVVALSALLTTTMKNMATTIEVLKGQGLRGDVKVIVGGAPLSEEYAREIGADGYASDAGRAVSLVERLVT